MKPTSTLGAGCLVIEDNKVLLVKPNYGKAKDCWILPGGFVEDGEDLHVAGLRELREETGQAGEIVSPFCIRYRREPSDVYWVFRMRLAKYEPLIVQTDELIDVQFIPIEIAIRDAQVRPMTRYFIECSQSNTPHLIALPPEFEQNNYVFFINEKKLGIGD